MKRTYAPHRNALFQAQDEFNDSHLYYQANLRGALLPMNFRERLRQYFRDRLYRFDQTE
jgi:hypothetical protein